MPEYKLTYFDGMGLAEPTRILFNYMNQPFTDIRIKREDWPQIKKDTPWGKLPVLEVDGKKVCQSLSIARYVGTLAGLNGKNNWESLQMDMIVDCAQDMRLEASAFFREQDEKKKEEMKQKFFTETVPMYLGKFDQQIKENNGYLVNGKLSWADIVICSQMQMLSALTKQDIISEKYPNLKGLLDKFVNHPKLKDYLAKRPKTEF